ncbi:MAG TPA: nitrogenase iron-molybdenum cofactor biosynthesis protein NifN, partial [Paenibacillaceae bacterium]|nr:nitrogenase iron-molybdenum cofactor biosynthesis protein NifN [Paenibacillaceae bacterium]
VPYRVFPSLTGLQVNDDFFSFLQTWRRKKTPIKYLWHRENLLDAMLDAHFYFGGKSAVVALEPDHLYAISGWLKEMGISLQGILSSIPTPILKRMKEEVWIGDLGDLEDIARGVNLWISNSHGKQGAERIGAHFIPLGFPVFDRLGTPIFTSVGYRGTTDLLIQVGNQLLED